MSGTPKLLLVEDDRPLAEMYGKKLGNNGYHVTIAKDGQSAVTRAKSESFDVIVLDLMLPGYSGIEVLEMLRSDKKTVKIPIIVYTNYGDVKNKEKCFTYGADDFILKVDSSPESLCQTVNKLLTEKKIETV